ncbi:TetR/AcrR family transcriptional regulator [Streptomyces sp. NBC_00536]|uniref:TetR/AcrR family transcriptional regulator n=1 Tax=Streptomyces sp. NBC_00536 TaxID=2975769 RepID=UPI002E821A7D|nr:TetR/AcrR family transcriptional regulator [Streptomyces sp. NBC_00536]WUC81692.1 TetR/AcrR family transcriptional regulator [Streptomyces sp. NBC_00536]
MMGSRWSAESQGRRRGPELDLAILDAALEQLSTVGWNGLTMEGVAAQARTGKAAVYRRWPSKADLVADVLRAGLPPLGEIPDHGSIREDLVVLCRGLRDAMNSRAGTALRSVLHECDNASADRFHELIRTGLNEPSHRLFHALVQRGIERGDVRPDATGGFVADVIPAIMMYRSKVCGSEWEDPDIREMIDQVLVPLLSA